MKYSESRVHEVEHNVKYLRRENEELKLDCEILRDQVNQITGHSRKGSLTDPESNGSQISRFEFQENSTRQYILTFITVQSQNYLSTYQEAFKV